MKVEQATESNKQMSMNKPHTSRRLPLATTRLAPVATFLCLIALHVSGLAADELRWKLAAGERYQAEISLNSGNLSEYETRTSGLSTETQMEISWQVREVTDGVATIEEKLERIVMQFDAPAADPAKKIFFDSNDPATATNFPADQKAFLQSMIGATFIVRMKGDGTIESAECTPETLAAMKTAPANSSLRDLLAPEAISKLFNDSTFVLPADEQTSKQGWSISETSESPWGTLQMERRYALAGEEQVESKPLLKFTAEFKSSLASPTAESENAKVAEKSTLKQHSGKGEWYFDPAEGHFTSGQFTVKIEADRTYREETMKTSYTRNTTFRLRKLK